MLIDNNVNCLHGYEFLGAVMVKTNGEVSLACCAEAENTEQISLEILRSIHNFNMINLGQILSGVSQMEFFVLFLINEKGGCKNTRGGENVSAIANYLSVSTPAVSRTLKGLEQRGYIERFVDNSNRRNTYVCITEKGRTAVKTQGKAINGFLDNVVKRLGAEKINKLRELSSEFGTAVKQELSAQCGKTGL